METNKFQERCNLCEKAILPGEGVFEKRFGKYIIKHVSCGIVIPTPAEEIKLIQNEGYIPFVFENRNLVYYQINLQLRKAFKKGSKEFYFIAQDIFTDCLDLFTDKYVLKERAITNNKHALNIVVRISVFQTLKWVSNKIDSDYIKRLHPSERANAKPPSVYHKQKYQREWRKKNGEAFNARRRAEYNSPNSKTKAQRKARHLKKLLTVSS
jgi:hypothetical protein